MSELQNQRVTVELLGKEQQFACPAGQEEALKAAAKNLNDLVEQMKQRSTVRNDQKALLMKQNEKLQLQLLNQDKTVSLINKPMMSVKKSILDVKIITYPIILIVLFVMVSMMRYYFQKAKNLSKQRNSSDTEPTKKIN